MKKTIAILITLVFILMAAVPMVSSGGGPTTELIAGHEIDIGGVIVGSDATNIYVRYVITADDWYLLETDTHIGTTSTDFPLNKGGNPAPGRFDYKMFFEKTGLEQDYQEIIPITGFSGTVYISAHAVVYNSETGKIFSAWGDGTRFNTRDRGSFGTYFTYLIT